MQGIKQTGAAKWTAGAISPSINLNADSAATASFGIEIKEAGYDAICACARFSQDLTYREVRFDVSEAVRSPALGGTYSDAFLLGSGLQR